MVPINSHFNRALVKLVTTQCCQWFANVATFFRKKLWYTGATSRRWAQQTRVVSRPGLFGSGSGLKLTKIPGLIRARAVLFVLGAQKCNQNNLATLLNFSNLT